MTNSAEIYLDEGITNHAAQAGADPPTWYVGISSDPIFDLFTLHKVRTDGAYMIVNVTSMHRAKAIRDSLCQKFRAKTGRDSTFGDRYYVFCYRITEETRQ